MPPFSRAFVALAATSIIAGGCAATGGSTSESATVGGGDPVAGRVAFENSCASCHGSQLQGTDQGPSFLDPVYVPSHHGDAAFRIAPKRGVQQHHWRFGNMPPVEGITDQEIEDIIVYVRQVQRDAGLFE